MGGDEGQLPPELLQAMQRGMDEEMLLADMLGNIPADEAAELQRLVQEGDLQMLSCSQVLLLSCYRTLLFFSCRASAPCARRWPANTVQLSSNIHTLLTLCSMSNKHMAEEE